MYKKYFCESVSSVNEEVRFEGEVQADIDQEVVSKLEEVQHLINAKLGDNKIKDIVVHNDMIEVNTNGSVSEYVLNSVNFILNDDKEVPSALSIIVDGDKSYAMSNGKVFGLGVENEVAEFISGSMTESEEDKTIKRLPENDSKSDRIAKLKEARAKREKSDRIAKIKESIRNKRMSESRVSKLKESIRSKRMSESKADRIASIKAKLRESREANKVNVRFGESKSARIQAIKESIRAKRLGESKINVTFKGSKADRITAIKESLRAKLKESRSSKINVKFV